MNVLVTGSGGFVGRNLCLALSKMQDVRLLKYDIGNTCDELVTFVCEADFVFHLAGVNRPKNEEEFKTGNSDFTEQVLGLLRASGRRIPVVISSSIQAALENPYGKSKNSAEKQVFAYGSETGAPVYVFRLANVFGKWCRPNYNSAVSTWCHNIARGLEVQVRDKSASVTLVYIDDVMDAFVSAMRNGCCVQEEGFCVVTPTYTRTLGEITDLLFSFWSSRGNRSVPDQSDAFTKKLYATYLSYLPETGFGYGLKMNVDDRGSFTEFIRTVDRGQVSVNISKPHIVKGQHWHHTKHEKFLVVSGKGVIRFRSMDEAWKPGEPVPECEGGIIGEDGVIEYFVSGERLFVIEIPPGYTHNIENLGETDLVTVMWANEAFDPGRPDTYFEPV